MLNDLSDRRFSDVAQLWCSGLEFYFEGFFSLGVSSGDGWC